MIATLIEARLGEVKSLESFTKWHDRTINLKMKRRPYPNSSTTRNPRGFPPSIRFILMGHLSMRLQTLAKWVLGFLFYKLGETPHTHKSEGLITRSPVNSQSNCCQVHRNKSSAWSCARLARQWMSPHVHEPGVYAWIAVKSQSNCRRVYSLRRDAYV